MAVMIYALYTYHWRAASIRTGGRGPYDDRVGPVSTSLRYPRLFPPLTKRHRQFCVPRCSVGSTPSYFIALFTRSSSQWL